MAQSLVKLYVHLIFSTKHRACIIKPEISDELYNYIGGILNNLGCKPIKIGGNENHIHILCNLAKNISIIQLLQGIKQSSSKWIKIRNREHRNFYWQDGYGAYTVSPDRVENLILYIENQRKHHQKKTFEQEFLEILIENGIEYDPLYIWD
jgi:putative transposase